MYTIKRNSWHYELAQKGGLSDYMMFRSKKVTLCQYVWFVTKRVLFVAIATFVFGFIGIYGGYGILANFFDLLDPSFIPASEILIEANPSNAFQKAVVLGSLVILGIVITGALLTLLMLIGYITYGITQLLGAIRPKNKEPSFITKYIEDRKKKVCTLVEFED